MKKRSLIICVALLVSLMAALGGTLAYLTDEDTAVNVMTLGNVDIEIRETEPGQNGTEVEFNQYKPLYPAVITGGNVVGSVDKIVRLENVGPSAAYVSTFLAFPSLNGRAVTLEDDSPIIFQYDEAFKMEDIQVIENVKLLDKEDNKEKDYTLFVFTYDAALAPGSKTEPTLLSFYMNPDVTNDDLEGFGGLYRVDVGAWAVQTANFDGYTAAEALEKAFGAASATNHPWKDGLPSIPPMTVNTVDELQEAINSGNPVALAKDMTLDEPLTINEDAFLDLNGKALTIPEGVTGIDVTDGAELTISNGQLDMGTNEGIIVSNTKEGTTSVLNLNNVDFTAETLEEDATFSIIAEAEAGAVEVNIGEDTNIVVSAEHYAPIYVGANATINMTGGLIDLTKATGYQGGCVWGIYLGEDTSAFNMSGGTIDLKGAHSISGIYNYGTNPTVNITGGTINVATSGGFGIAVELYGKRDSEGLNFSFTGGTMNIMSPPQRSNNSEAIYIYRGNLTFHKNAVINVYESIWEDNDITTVSTELENRIKEEVTVNYK